MCKFSIPVNKDGKDEFFSFTVEPKRLLFAGSRHISVSQDICRSLVDMFDSLGFSFLTGCARGVDESFRAVFKNPKYKAHSLVACAFKKRACEFKSLYPLYVVPAGLHPRAALAKRTLWMTSRCSLLILFPFGSAQGRASGTMGRGSALAFKSTIMNSKPVFVVSKERPKESELYTVLPSNLFGVVDGYWCIPPVYKKTGLCYEAV